MPSNLGTLYVQCQRGRGLYNVEVLGRKMDPYAKLQFQGKEHKTKTADNGHKAPEWVPAPTFDFPVSDSDAGPSNKRILVVEVYEANKVRDDSMIGCNYSFDIAPFVGAASSEQEPAFHSWVNLQTVGGKPGGEVMLKIWFTPNPATQAGRLSGASEGISLSSISKAAGRPGGQSSGAAGPAVWVPPSLQQQQPAQPQPQQQQQQQQQQQPQLQQQHAPASDHNRRPSNPQLYQQAPPSPIPPRTSSAGPHNQSLQQRPVLPGGYPEAPPPVPTVPQQHSGGNGLPRPLPPNPSGGGVYPPPSAQGPPIRTQTAPYPPQQQQAYPPMMPPGVPGVPGRVSPQPIAAAPGGIYPPPQQHQPMQHSGGSSGVYPPTSPYGPQSVYPPAPRPPAAAAGAPPSAYPPNVYPPTQHQAPGGGSGHVYPANDLYPPPQPVHAHQTYPPNHLYPAAPVAVSPYPPQQQQHQGVYPPPNHLYPPNGPPPAQGQQQGYGGQAVYVQHSGQGQGGVYQIQSGGRPAPGLPPR